MMIEGPRGGSYVQHHFPAAFWMRDWHSGLAISADCGVERSCLLQPGIKTASSTTVDVQKPFLPMVCSFR